MTRVRVVTHPEAIRPFARSQRWIRTLEREAEPTLRASRTAAPESQHGSHGRPPGHLKRSIVLRTGVRAGGAYVRIVTTAKDLRGVPYGIIQNRRRPYLRPVKP